MSFDPGVRAGLPTIGHTPTPVAAIGALVWAGKPVEEVAVDYLLRPADVLVACWWLGIHGGPRWQGRWRAWAESVHRELWHGRYDVPAPPTGSGEAASGC